MCNKYTIVSQYNKIILVVHYVGQNSHWQKQMLIFPIKKCLYLLCLFLVLTHWALTHHASTLQDHDVKYTILKSETILPNILHNQKLFYNFNTLKDICAYSLYIVRQKWLSTFYNFPKKIHIVYKNDYLPFIISLAEYVKMHNHINFLPKKSLP